MIDSSIIYSLSSGIYDVRIITQDVHNRTWVPNTDTPDGGPPLSIELKDYIQF